MIREEVGKRIRELRISKNLTRDQLAEKTMLSSKFIYEVENGKKGLSVDSLFKIATVLSCSCDYILMGKNEEERRFIKILQILAKLEEKDVIYVSNMLEVMKEVNGRH